MIATLSGTRAESAPLVARTVLALVMFPHGAQHALGWFGGPGLTATVAWMSGTLGIPWPLAALAVAVELIAPVALLVGVGGRVAAASLMVLMIVAASIHIPNGFFMNWFGTLKAGSEGYEYHLIVIGLASVIALMGSGMFSVDYALFGGGNSRRRTRLRPARG